MTEIPVLDGEELYQLLRTYNTHLENELTDPAKIHPEPYWGDSKNSSLFYFYPSMRDERLVLCTFYVNDFIFRRLRKKYSPTGEFHFAGNTGKPVPMENEDTDDLILPITDYGFIQGGILHAAEYPISSDNYAYFIGPTKRSIDFWMLPKGTEFRLLWPAGGDIWFSPILYQDDHRTLLIKWTSVWHPMGFLFDGYHVESLYHPYVSYFIEHLYQQGVDGLLKPQNLHPLFRQGISKKIFGTGSDQLSEKNSQILSDPAEEISFEPHEAYTLYNWELFFHIPLLIADRLSQNQQFEAAQQWFHYIFEPTEVIPKDDPTRGAWRVKPFFESREPQKSIEDLMRELNGGDLSFVLQVMQWRSNPFKPHLLARLREGTPYMKTVLMKYIDNLIAWADTLFRRDTIESINEATQIYLLAATILGPRPQELPECRRAEQTYASLKDVLDAFSNAEVAIENEIVQAGPSELSLAAGKLLPQVLNYQFVLQPQLQYSLAGMMSSSAYMSVSEDSLGHALTMRTGSYGFTEAQKPMALADLSQTASRGLLAAVSSGTSFSLPSTLYFCIPWNSRLMSYWDTVADRLFKIRHCMNIEGVVRQLPLFEPPIEPGLLVRAAAAGIDLSSVLADVSPTLPHYRFSLMLQKATELCAEVKGLGAALLEALEKRDAEELSLVRSTHEIRLLDAITEVKEKQIKDAEASLQGLQRAKELVELRRDHYANLEFMNAAEKQQLDLMASAMALQQKGQFLQMAASAAHKAPQVKGGYTCMGGVTTAESGGEQVAKPLEVFAWYLNSISSMLNTAATQSSISGGYQRRSEEWDLQKRSAAKEIQQIGKQIIAAEMRLAIAEKDKDNHEQQIENAAEIDEYLRSKFTNQELYDWMVSQLATLYFQSYQLAYEVAKRAELCYRFELGIQDSNFIQFGYWDSLKEGLLAGEKLQYDLRRLEADYFEQNRREFEITKHISLALLDPVALINLKENNECFVSLPEALFDLDYPGHYMRRIKSVSLTIPCVTGPYTNVNCTLTMLKNEVRISSSPTGNDGNYMRDENGDDPRFKDNIGAIQSIATSNAQNDSGVFELNFRDERYLPFEGAGVISEWRLELPDKFRQFDYDTISDIVFHINYTARDGGEALKTAATEAIILALPEEGLVRMFSARHEFPGEWHSFLHPTETADVQDLQLDLKSEQFPFLFHGKTITVNAVALFFKLKDGFTYNDSKPLTFYLYSDGEPLLVEDDGITPKPLEFRKNGSPITDLPFAGLTDLSIKIPGNLKMQVKETDLNPVGAGTETDWWKIVETKTRLKPEAIDGILIVAQYSVSELKE